MSTKQTIEIQEYNLVDLLQSVVRLTKEGYELDIESNEGYPKQFGTRFVLQMQKDPEDTTKDTPQPTKRGPKAKTAETD